MGINTDLNVEPYFDDYDETKQYNRVLFKPARPVQARELTQLQTILQNQVERMGNNIYKEGTIIRGCSATELKDLNFVKLDDDVTGLGSYSLSDFSPYYASEVDAQTYSNIEEGDFLSFKVTGLTSGLTAQIINTSNGFETRNPDLKTLYIKYLSTRDNVTVSDKEFTPGEELSIENPFGVDVATITVTQLENATGKSYGYEVREGIIYQKGHFCYVQPQSIVISKYDPVPDDVAVGFLVEENVVNSNQDNTLLDNAQGFNNFSAPGADRLQLVPKLISYPLGSVPDGFFAIAKYKDGSKIRIRDITEFNSIEKTLAARTYDESGDYVVEGLDCKLVQKDLGDRTATYISVAPGHAYVKGFKVQNYGNQLFEVEGSEGTENVQNQSIGVTYGNFLEFNPNSLNIQFSLSGVEYILFNESQTEIGTCSVRNVEVGKIYIYNIRKKTGSETEKIGFIGTTTAKMPVTPGLRATKYAPLIFANGGNGATGIQNTSITRRRKFDLSGTTPTSTLSIPFAASAQPVVNGNYFVVDQESNYVAAAGDGSLDFDTAGNPTVLNIPLSEAITPQGSVIYYDEVLSSASADVKTSLDVYVRSFFNTAYRRANLGLPDGYEIISIKEIDTSQGEVLKEGLENKFTLYSNQKDGFYDYSYIELKNGETYTPASGSQLLIHFKVFKRETNVGGGFLNSNSYINVNRLDVPLYSATNGKVYDLTKSFDFRPYVVPSVEYSVSIETAGTATNYLDVYQSTGQFVKNVMSDTLVTPANGSTITFDSDVYLSRKDAIVATAFGEIKLIKGEEAQKPDVPGLNDEMLLAIVNVPTAEVTITGPYASSITFNPVKRLTMKEIASFEKRINTLQEITALTLLEKAADDLLIPGADGLNRFKNGILVDSFGNLKIADVLDAEFNAAIDKGRQRLMPRVKQFPIYLKRKSGSNSNVSLWPDIITKEVSSEVEMVAQPYATNYRNAVSNFYKFQGKGSIYPEYDAGYDVTKNPDATINIDIESPLTSLVQAMNEINPNILAVTDPAQEVSRTEAFDERGENEAGQAGTWERQTINLEAERRTLSSTATIETRRVGEYLTNATFNPFIESKDIKIKVNGLRPNTQHYVYFEGDNLTNECYPGIPTPGGNDARNVARSGFKGDDLISSPTGELTVVLPIPAGTYYVGRNSIEIVDVDQYESIESSATSFATFEYNAYNFDISKQTLMSSTRTISFDTRRDIVKSTQNNDRFTPDPPPRRRRRGLFGALVGALFIFDPIAQTFNIRRNMVDGANYAFISGVDLYFKSKSVTNGCTVQLREVDNGYPTRTVIAFGSKHLDPADINVSNDGSAATTITWNNPVRLSVEKEYAIVVVPDANDPSFNLFTSKVGGADLASDRVVTQDWGDGALFTSTNDSAWKSYQDEDLKFAVKRYEFNTDIGAIEYEPDDMEYLTIDTPNGGFRKGEIVYTLISTASKDCGIDTNNRTRVFTSDASTPPADVGDYVFIDGGDALNRHVTKVISLESNDETGATDMIVESPAPFFGAVTATLAVGGELSYYDPYRPTALQIRKSSAKNGTKRFIVTQSIYGADSGASAVISAVENQKVNYTQAMMYKLNTPNTRTSFKLMNASNEDKVLPTNDSMFLTHRPVVIASKSNVVANITTQTFGIKSTMLNEGFSAISPILDDDISMLQGYEYKITNQNDTTSTYISKKVKLKSDLYADGLKVYVSAHRPPGTDVKVLARFSYNGDEENQSAFVALTALSDNLFSSAARVDDYIELEYEVPASAEREYSAFQVKIVMTSEDGTQIPYVKDYRAIAVT